MVPWDKPQGILIEQTLVFSIGKILNAMYSSIGSKGGIHNAEGNMFYY